MSSAIWSIFIDALCDAEERAFFWPLGHEVKEWVWLLEHDYDDVDRWLVDHETIGGG